MKKMMLVAGIISCSMMGFSQTTDTKTLDTPVTVAVATAPEERISKLEAEVASLKALQVEMKKQLTEIQQTLPANTKKKKMTVNRVGSKQVNWSKED